MYSIVVLVPLCGDAQRETWIHGIHRNPSLDFVLLPGGSCITKRGKGVEKSQSRDNMGVRRLDSIER